MKYIRVVLSCIRKADEKYGLFDKGDKIVLGISGGKDSMSLAYALSLYGKFKGKRFDLYPVMLDLGFPNFQGEKLKDYFDKLNYPLRIIDAKEVYPILADHQEKGKHIPCSICSRMKKAAINKVAEELHANKVAFAHHQDDAIETLFMNMIHGGRVATFSPKMALSKVGLTFIRPLIECQESDLEGLIKQENIPTIKSSCPADGFTEREFAKQELSRLYNLRTEAKESFAKMLSNYSSFCLYFDQIEIVAAKVESYAFKPGFYFKDALEYQKLADKYHLDNIEENSETMLILHRHKLAGQISYHYEDAHTLIITSFSLVKKEDSKDVLASFIDMEVSKINPLTVVYNAKEKKLALKAGFKKKENAPFLGQYVLRIIK